MVESFKLTQNWERLFLGLLFLVLQAGVSRAAGGDCMSGNKIQCFECNTWEDPRCHDPWSWAYPVDNMPPLKTCEGCCVKMVQFIGTEHYQIKRTCTDDFEVNFFMVNHACMMEGHRHGHMCFCEEDQCNAATNYFLHPLLLIIVLLLVR
ncbi:protein quiver [Eurytemora carolleeae]|uniref:protein quiver n=1 Tax=Eurytemora carolleeae TaxID=1294199 RepID=UPI000C77812E|nr:protein quiver [Eurytemora carolleeae]|eukprot:XP_023330337.1 protein quiver-like [Eurytemora affinis]